MQNEAKFFKKSNIKFWSMLYYFIVLRFPSLIYYILINKLQNTSKKRRQHQTKEIVNLKYTVEYCCLAYKLQCLTRISSLEKMYKFWIMFYLLDIANQLLSHCSPFAPLCQFDKWMAKHPPFLIQGPLLNFLVRKSLCWLYNKQNNT